MNFRRLESFMAVAELGSFSAASSKLHRSQAAVSTHVQQLEEELAVRLLERSTRRVALTAEGRVLLARCRTVMAELKDAARELGEHASLRRGHISIGTVPSISSLRMPAALAGFKQRHPGITLELHEGSASAIYQDLRDRVTDFAIAPAFGEAREFHHEPVLTDPFVAVLPRKAAFAGRSISLAELARYEQLAQPAETAVRTYVEQAFGRLGLEYRPTIEVSHHQSLLNMVGAGLGVALLPSICIPSRLQSGCHVVPLRERTLAREICIVTLRGKTLTPAATECAGMIAAVLQKHEGRKKAR